MLYDAVVLLQVLRGQASDVRARALSSDTIDLDLRIPNTIQQLRQRHHYYYRVSSE